VIGPQPKAFFGEVDTGSPLKNAARQPEHFSAKWMPVRR
jgi:hypothetical protein